MYYAATLPAVRPRVRRGMGSGQTAAQGVQIGSSVATPVITGILGAHAASVAAATGAPALILGMAPAIAIPIIGAAMVGVTIAVTLLIKNSGCGQTCVITSQWANEAQSALKANIDAYFALPVPRTKAQQGVGLANFDAVWAALVAQCGQAAVGDAGKRCISDRERGACKWRATENSQWPGGLQLGQCFNWFSAFRDPIANDSQVEGDSLASLFSPGEGSVLFPLALIAGLVLLGVAL